MIYRLNVIKLIVLTLINGMAIFSMTVYSQNPEKSKVVDDKISNTQLIEMLASDNIKLADEAIVEVIKRGEKIIPELLNQKGNKQFFYGTLAKNHNFTMEYYTPTSNAEINNRWLIEGKLVTVEVASIYLISAIFYESLDIAESPYLTDMSLPLGKRRAANSEDVVKKAWQVIEAWSEKLKKSNLDTLRKTNVSPFAESDIQFW